MLLTIQERLMALASMPSKGDVVMLKVIREAQGALGLSEDEIKRWGVVVTIADNGGMSTSWDEKVQTEVEIALGDAAIGILVTELKRLNDAKELTAQHLPLWDKLNAGNGGA